MMGPEAIHSILDRINRDKGPVRIPDTNQREHFRINLLPREPIITLNRIYTEIAIPIRERPKMPFKFHNIAMIFRIILLNHRTVIMNCSGTPVPEKKPLLVLG
jgi:hypothetical protein